jgi:NAD(P)-dependent dehydrogenase (short-subunit alcohol dehydrogenase family)
VDGLENQFATDHVGPFLFTKLLAPKLLAAATASYTPRVIFVASAAHAVGGGMDFDVLAKPDEAKYQISDAYFQAKSANILTAIELSRRSKGVINAYSLHPGGTPYIADCGGADVQFAVIFTNMTQKKESTAELQALGSSFYPFV